MELGHYGRRLDVDIHSHQNVDCEVSKLESLLPAVAS